MRLAREGAPYDPANDEAPLEELAFGLGVGVLILLGDSVGLRAGLAGQYYSLPLTKTKVSGGGISFESTTTVSGSRGMLLAINSSAPPAK